MTKRSKRALQIVGGVLLILALALGGLGYATFGGMLPIVEREVVPGVRTIKDGFVTLGVIDNGDGHLALVDCGNDATGKAILADFAKNGLHADGVRTIFLTHGHKDHTAACSLFPSATIIALPEDVGLVEGTTGSRAPIARLMPVKPTGVHVTHPAHDGDRVEIGSRTVRVLALPGHTAGSAAYLVDGVLFVGDAASINADGSLRGPPWAFSDDATQGKESLRKLGARLVQDHERVVAIVPSHSGALATPGAVETLQHPR